MCEYSHRIIFLFYGIAKVIACMGVCLYSQNSIALVEAVVMIRLLP